GKFQFVCFRLEGEIDFEANGAALAERVALDRDILRARPWLGRDLERIGGIHAAVRTGIPVPERREHGAGMLGVAGQHAVQRVFVIADELRPAAMSTREIVERKNSRKRVETAEG